MRTIPKTAKQKHKEEKTMQEVYKDIVDRNKIPSIWLKVISEGWSKENQIGAIFVKSTIIHLFQS